jgi:predicted RNA-binding Zn-ribbon protein involved in translation (DUF1610 family)
MICTCPGKLSENDGPHEIWCAMFKKEGLEKHPCSVCGEQMLDIGPSQTPPQTGRTYKCPYLVEEWHIEAAADITKQHKTLHLQRKRKPKLENIPLVPAASRDPVAYRYDVLYWQFIHAMAQIGHFGAEKYGELNYQKSKLIGDKSPVNHIANHLRKFIENKTYDHPEVGIGHKYHLVAIAFNAMMQFWYEDHPQNDKSQTATTAPPKKA